MDRPTRLALLTAMTLVGVATFAVTPRMARSCSLTEGPEPAGFPIPGETLHARPVFFSPVELEPTLTRVGGDPVELELVEELASTFTGFALTRAWRPRAPLAAGQYAVTGVASAHGGEAVFDFFVDPALPSEAPPLSGVTFSVTLDDPEEGGCGAMTSCDGVDFTKLELRIPEGNEVSVVRVELRNPKTNRRRIELAEVPTFAQSGQRSVLIWDNPSRWPGAFKRDSLCLTVQPLTDNGAIGPTLDLGCFDPNGEDPRVIDERGCSTGHSNGPLMLVWLALLVAIRARHATP